MTTLREDRLKARLRSLETYGIWRARPGDGFLAEEGSSIRFPRVQLVPIRRDGGANARQRPVRKQKLKLLLDLVFVLIVEINPALGIGWILIPSLGSQIEEAVRPVQDVDAAREA